MLGQYNGKEKRKKVAREKTVKVKDFSLFVSSKKTLNEKEGKKNKRKSRSPMETALGLYRLKTNGTDESDIHSTIDVQE